MYARRCAIMEYNHVTVCWQDNVIFHKKTRNFIIGENDNSYKVDFNFPIEKLGTQYWKLLDNNIIYVPIGAQVIINGIIAFESKININNGDSVRIDINDFSFLINRSDEVFIISKFDSDDLISNHGPIAMSAIFHAMLIFAFAFFMPPLGINDAEASADKDQLFLMQQYLSASAEREQKLLEEEHNTTEQSNPSNEGGTGTRAKGEEGGMGSPTSKQLGKSYAIAGSLNNKDIHIARENALRDASNFGLIGILNIGSGGDPLAPTAIWGRDDSQGANPFSAKGNMWGDSLGESYGAGGLGLSGIGESGGGIGEGIGLGNIGTIGKGAGLGDKQGFGNGLGHLSKGHKVKSPYGFRTGATIVNGKLPPEIIQRIIRQNHGRFRLCFENGLRNNPSLQGRVAVRFVIGRDGSVSNVSNGGSDLPDNNVVQCVVRAYYGLSFPEPENGIVTVVYPIIFTAQ